MAKSSDRLIPSKHKLNVKPRVRYKGSAHNKVRKIFGGVLDGITIREIDDVKGLEGVWVVEFEGLILASYKRFPHEVWKKLTSFNRPSVVPPDEIPEERQMFRRLLFIEHLKRIEFWDRVQKGGVKKYQKMNLEVTECEIRQREKTARRRNQ